MLYYYTPEQAQDIRRQAEELGFATDLPLQNRVDAIVEETLRLREQVKKIAANN